MMRASYQLQLQLVLRVEGRYLTYVGARRFDVFSRVDTIYICVYGKYLLSFDGLFGLVDRGCIVGSQKSRHGRGRHDNERCYRRA